MTLPALLFGFLLSTLYGAAAHLLLGGRAGRFLLFLLLGWAGFWTGQLLANQLQWTFGSLGVLHLGMATLSSLGFLLCGYWLSLVGMNAAR
jgi:hypothetical protein